MNKLTPIATTMIIAAAITARSVELTSGGVGNFGADVVEEEEEDVVVFDELVNDELVDELEDELELVVLLVVVDAEVAATNASPIIIQLLEEPKETVATVEVADDTTSYSA
jgi:hypothetical protein